MISDDESSVDDDVQLLPLSIDMQPSSPVSDISTDDADAVHPANGVIRRIGQRFASFFGSPQSTRRGRSRRRRGVMFFLPAFSAPSGDITLPGDDTSSVPALARSRSSQRSFHRPDKYPLADPEADGSSPGQCSSAGRSAGSTLPSYNDVAVFRTPAGNADASSTRRPHSNSRLS